MAKRPKPVTSKNVAMLRERIARGGDLDPETLSWSFGVPVPDVRKILQQGRVS